MRVINADSRMCKYFAHFSQRTRAIFQYDFKICHDDVELIIED